MLFKNDLQTRITKTICTIPQNWSSWSDTAEAAHTETPSSDQASILLGLPWVASRWRSRWTLDLQWRRSGLKITRGISWLISLLTMSQSMSQYCGWSSVSWINIVVLRHICIHAKSYLGRRAPSTITKIYGRIILRVITRFLCCVIFLRNAALYVAFIEPVQ